MSLSDILVRDSGSIKLWKSFLGCSIAAGAAFCSGRRSLDKFAGLDNGSIGRFDVSSCLHSAGIFNTVSYLLLFSFVSPRLFPSYRKALVLALLGVNAIAFAVSERNRFSNGFATQNGLIGEPTSENPFGKWLLAAVLLTTLELTWFRQR